MKNIQHIIKRTLVTFSFGLVFISCQSSLEDIYDNPNAVTTIDDAALFTKATRDLFIQTTGRSTYGFTGQYAHYFVAGSSERRPDQYGDNFDGDYNDFSEDMYGGVIRHIEEVLMITSTEGTKNDLRNAMANVIAVMGYTVITDAYGEIPYTEGGKGKTEGIINPKYDTQEYIYKDLIERLSESIAILKIANPAEGYPESDPIYDNDLNKWVRLANSVRLRLAMRIRYADNTLSKQVVSQCLEEPLMEDPSHDASLVQTEGNGNSWYFHRTKYPGIKVSEMMIDQLMSTADPRLPVFVSKDMNGNYSGQLNGLNDESFGISDFVSKSDIGVAISSKESKMYVMTATETWFLRAEAALAYDNDPTTANELFRKGIETSLIQWDVENLKITDFMSNSTTSLTGTNDQMEEQIGTQMWIAITPNYFESWSNIRRTGYPVIAERKATNLSRGVTNGIMPKRFLYSTIEMSTNGKNINEAISRQGPNKIDTPVWWDKN
ncbi:MAG: SusD/RagB family nutrient-binding outer membrane lipoprotein [Bacteroidota bacterium]